MMHDNDLKTFNDLSEKYSTWIVKYCSTTFHNHLYLVWYSDTDENGTDRLLTFKNGDIFASESLENLKKTILSSIENLNEFENLNSWLYNFNNFEVIESCTYDLISIENEIRKNNLSIETIEGFANFVNLFEDFINQDEKNLKLKVYADNKLIKEVWNYFYDFIFWPKFNDKVKFDKWERPPLIINTKELLVNLIEIIKIFDESIKYNQKCI